MFSSSVAFAGGKDRRAEATHIVKTIAKGKGGQV